MFRRFTRKSAKKSPWRPFRMSCELLEDRAVPHTGVATFSAGITPDSAPAGITQGPDSNFWFVEYNSSRIARITPSGTVTEFTLPAGRGPLNIVTGPDGNLWFTENTGDRIGRITPTGSDTVIQASIIEFVVPGAGSAPNDIANGPDGALWFTQSGSDEIGRITITGTVTEFAVPGVGSTPAGICAGSDGALWFTEGGSGQIGRVTVAGNITEFTIPVGNAGSFADPEDIVSGPGGHLYFTDFGRSMIGRVTTAGAFTHFELPVNRGPQGIASMGDGDLYFTEAASGRIGRLPASALAPGQPTYGAPPLEEFDFIPTGSVPLGLVTDSKNDIWFTMNGSSAAGGTAIGNFISHLQQLTITASDRTVQVYDTFLNQVRAFQPFPSFSGTFSVAVADENGNGIPDSIVGAGPGGGPHVRVFDGSDNRELASFFAFDPSYRDGIFLGADDVNGDGRNDIIVSAGTMVKIIDGFKLAQVQSNGVIADAALITQFRAFPFSYLGKDISIAAGDLNGDSKADIVVGAGPGGGSAVRVIDSSKFGLIGVDGQVPTTAELSHFDAFGSNFRGGVYVAVSKNVAARDVIVGAGLGGGPHVKIIAGSKITQVQNDGLIASSALRSSFFAYDPIFRGGVRVGADDLNFDGLAELTLSAGPRGGPHVKIVDGSKITQIQSDGQIAPAALNKSFFAGDPNFRGGVFIASDADHRDGTIFGPPGVTVANSRRDINDIFVFQSPSNPANSVLVMDVSPFSTAVTPAGFAEGGVFDFRIANRDLLNTTDDIVFRVTFGPQDMAQGGRQDTVVRALPAARFAGTGGVIVKTFTGMNATVRGVGGSGAQFRAAEQDDPFFFDAAAFSKLLNFPTAVDGVLGGVYPSGTFSNGNAITGTPNYDGPNFFGPSVNTLSMILEIPSNKLTAPGSTTIGFWGRTEFGGVQADRMGRPAINTALIPQVPRGSNFPLGSGDLRNAFNAGHPRDDRANFQDAMTGVIAAYYPIGQPNGTPNTAQANIVASLLLPDILVYDSASNAGFFGDTVGTLGQPDFFLAGGRKLSDDIISTELSILTDPDTPFNLDGGADQQPFLRSQNVADDNGLNLTDGSVVGPGTGLAGSQRTAVFPYIGSRNTNPTGVPTGNPPP